MTQEKIKFIWEETSELHEDVTSLYEALADESAVEAAEIIDTMREKLLAIKKDLNTNGI